MFEFTALIVVFSGIELGLATSLSNNKLLAKIDFVSF